MPLSFLQPTFLYGLAAASAPIIIHLINRRRAVVRRFPTVEFLRLAERRVARRHRLKHWLLLLLRTAAICLLALIMARPVLTGSGALGIAGDPLSLALILDNSLSMGYQEARAPRFALATEAAARLLRMLRPDDRAVVIPTDGSGPKPLSAVTLTAGPAQYARSLRQAFEALEAPAPRKQIVLVTDLAWGGWRQFTLAQVERVDPQVPVQLIAVGDPALRANLAVKAVATREGGAYKGVPARLEVTVANFGAAEARDQLVQLYLDGRKADQKAVTVPRASGAGMSQVPGEATASFTVIPEQEGVLAGEVRLPPDPLAADNTAYFALQVQGTIRTLVVDGDPGLSLASRETFYLAPALNPERTDDAPILPDVVSIAELPARNLATYQAIILANVGELGGELAQRLRSSVQGGRGLIIFLGDKVNPEGYNQGLYAEAGLLPARLRAIRRVAETTGIEPPRAPHPVLRPFQAAGMEALVSARFAAYVAVEPPADPQVRTVLALRTGDPLLLERRVGAGRVWLFTSTADRDWNDLSIKTAYLPLMQALVREAANRTLPALGATVEVGQPLILRDAATAAGQVARIRTPSGATTLLTLTRGTAEAAAAFTHTTTPGLYRVELPGQSQAYAVNPPFEESQVERLPEQELKRLLAPLPVTLIPYRGPEDLARLQSTQRELWKPLFLLLLLALAAELAFAQRLTK
ncbi:MAG: BatA domain-containing protein [Deltaproteobacteria bacterium]|nr:BatA domain-containing protein [Deltaproteobacteria bacterium]